MKYAVYAVAGLTLCAVLFTVATGGVVRAEDAAKAEPMEVLETYELMEEIVEPTFQGLQAAAQKEPEGRKDWQALYNGAFMTAELMNLLYFRADEDYTGAEWAKMATDTRQAAVDLGEAVKTQDFAAVTEKYKALVASCNRCHVQFIGEDEVVIEAYPEE